MLATIMCYCLVPLHLAVPLIREHNETITAHSIANTDTVNKLQQIKVQTQQLCGIIICLTIQYVHDLGLSILYLIN